MRVASLMASLQNTGVQSYLKVYKIQLQYSIYTGNNTIFSTSIQYLHNILNTPLYPTITIQTLNTLYK